MQHCELETISPGVHRCRSCRRKFHGPAVARRECTGAHPLPSPAPRPAPVPSLPQEEIRVGLLLHNWCCGGVERYHEALYKWTSRRIRWSGLCIPDNGPTMPGPMAAVARHMPILTAAELCQASDIIITWAVKDLSIVGDFPGRVVAMSHGDGDWLRALLRPSCSRATDFVAVSNEAANAFLDSVRQRVAILPAGVEIDRISPSRPRGVTRQDWGVRPDQFAVGFVGRFSAEKNPLQVARIVAELDERFVAVYHGHNYWGEEKFKQEATSIAGGRIRFVPQTVHTGDVYAGLDCLVQASPAEGGPLVAIEAWLTDTPLVTTDVGIVHDDAELRELSYVASHSASVSEWARLVQDACWSYGGQSVRRIAAERYSAAAAARRWEEYLIGIAN